MNALNFLHQSVNTKNKRRLVALGLLLTSIALHGDTNSWIKPGDGLWQETNSWSLGILPDSLQAVQISNGGSKTVEIDSMVATNQPQSLIEIWKRRLCVDHRAVEPNPF
jgi:hypothetical protein